MSATSVFAARAKQGLDYSDYFLILSHGQGSVGSDPGDLNAAALRATTWAAGIIDWRD
ncbi:MAG: hypothetical protein OEQ39_04245 [Gammaproteobacteria bacterium]|nr:hypothetical protein [Gammaproteobacteria bacterium]